MRMNNIELISRLSDVIGELSEIVKLQQNAIEQSEIEKAVKKELRMKIAETETALCVIDHGTLSVKVSNHFIR